MQYQAKPVVVTAFKITAVKEKTLSGAQYLKLENGEDVFATAPMLARLTPKVGDYFVTQPDGYQYLNPKDVFESKYEAVEA